jgi:hypothetical protein
VVDRVVERDVEANKFTDLFHFIVKPIVLGSWNVAIDRLEDRFAGLVIIKMNLFAMLHHFIKALIQ